MPVDGSFAESSKLTISGDGQNDDGGINAAAKRLAQEAQRALTFGQRSVRDVTEEFAAAAKKLQPGQLVKDEYFTLFESVSALEIMDPKMDSGCVPPGDTLEPEFDVCQGLAPENVIWIMDQLLCLTSIWLDGYPLSQTIFTSLHVNRLLSPDNMPPYTFSNEDVASHRQTTEERLVHDVLRAYCIALIKCCAQVLHVIQSQIFFEEEDFVAHLFGRELLCRCSADDAIRLVDEARQWLLHAPLDGGVRAALEARLQFVRTYLALLVNDLDDWSDLSDTLETLANTHHLAQPISESFSDKVQRQLATSTPPRPMLEISWEDAYQRWTRMCADIVEAERLTSDRICQSPHSLHRALWAFAYREPQPSTFARAHIQNRLFGSDRITDNMTLFDLFLTDIRDLVLTGDPLADPDSFRVELPSDPRHRCSRIMEAFMDRAFDEYLNLYRMVCQNRCRIRRTFTQAIPILDALESEAIRTDGSLHDVVQPTVLSNSKGRLNITLDPLTSWTKFVKLQIMAWTVQLGFETDIYLPDELCLMYWLLSEFAQRRCKVLEHIERCLVERMTALNRTRNTRYIAQCLGSQDLLRSLQVQANVQRRLARALWRFTSLLQAVRIIKPPKRDVAKEQLLWDARMKPYLSVCNDPIPKPEAFRLASLGSVDESYNLIDADVQEAKGHLAELKQMTPEQAKYVGTEEQWKKEIKHLEKTCVGIAVQKSQLLRICEKRLGAKTHESQDLGSIVSVSIPPPESRYHSWWAVPQIKEKNQA